MNCPNCNVTFEHPYKAMTRTCPDCLAAEPTCPHCQGVGFIHLTEPDDLCPCCGTWLAGGIIKTNLKGLES